MRTRKRNGLAVAALAVGAWAAAAAPSFQMVTLDAAYVGYERDVGDVNGDGANDVVCVSENEQVIRAFLAPNWTNVVLATPTGAYIWPRADDFKVSDLDGDGDADLVVRLGPAQNNDAAGIAAWFENRGASGWTQRTIGTSSGYVKDICVADLDRDGRRDVVMRQDSETQMYFQESNGWTTVAFAHAAHEGMEVADLDMDGDPDVILNGFWFPTPNTPAAARNGANYSNVVIDAAWFNQGGDWTADSCKVVVGDFDGDGTNDVAFSHSERAGYAVAWYRSPTTSAAGTWTKRAVEVVDYCHTLQAADWDLDGDEDLLVGGMIQSPHKGLKLLLNGGAGTTWTGLAIQSDGSYSAESGDIDNDGDPDVVGIRNWDSGPTYIYRNSAAVAPGLDSWFYKQVSAAHVRTFGLCFPDVDGDGDRDLASGPFVYLNPGPPLTGTWSQIALPSGVHAFATLDADGDGLADLIAQKDYSGASRIDLYWVEATNAAGTAWKTPVRLGDVPRGTEAEGFQGYRVAQLVAGGRPEIVVNSPQGLYYFAVPAANPEAGNWPRTFIAANNSEEGLGVADIDGDGDLDVSFTHANPHEVKWARNPGDGGSPWSVFAVGSLAEAVWPDRCEAADLNGDGRVDIVATEENSGGAPDALACWWEQPAGGATNANWTRHVLATQYTLNSLDLGDLDQDGDVDVVLAEHRGTERIAVWQNDGLGNFAEKLVGAGHESHLGGRLADFDGDGDLDLASIAYDNFAEIHIWRNDRSGGSPALAVAPATRSVGPGAETTTFAVTNSGSGTMAYSAIAETSWLRIAGGGSGGNFGTVSVACAANVGAVARTGTVVVAAVGAAGSPRRVSVVQAPTVLSPSGGLVVQTRRPVFAWSAVAGATWYQIWLTRNGQPRLARWVEGASTWTPPEDLPGGSYRWWMQPWGPAIGLGAWAGPADFSIPVASPGAPEQIAPSGLQSGYDLSYRWQKETHATWYRLWVGRIGAGTWHDRWFALSGAGEAVVNPGGANPGPAKPIPTAPSGAIAGNVPTFQWSGGACAWWLQGWGPDGYGPWAGPKAFQIPYAAGTWVRVYVNRGASMVVDQWTQAANLPSPKVLSPGAHAWWLGVWDAQRNQTLWSDRTDFSVP